MAELENPPVMERLIIVNIDLRDTGPVKQKSFTIGEMRKICRLDKTSHWELCQGTHGDFWKGDPRVHPEHLEYMLAVVNGILTEQEASDLWALRRPMIKDELSNRALAGRLTARSKKKATA